MAIGDIIRFTRKVELDGQLHVNVMHFSDQVETRPDGLMTLLELWDQPTVATYPENVFKGLQNGYTSLVQIGFTAQVIWPTEGEIIEKGFATVSTPADDSGLPTFAQTKFSIATTRNDRSGRGGFYVGGIAELMTAGNQVTSAYQNKQQNVINMFNQFFALGGANYDGYLIGVWSQLHLEWNMMTSMSAASDLGTMRSRRLGRGV